MNGIVRFVLVVGLLLSVPGIGFGQAEQEALVKLQSGKADVRRDAAKKLGDLRSRDAADELAQVAANDPDPEVRRAAVVALGRIGDRSRTADMVAVLEDPDAKVRGGAIEGLVNLYLDRDPGFFTRVRSGLVRVVPFWDERQTQTVDPWVEVDPQITTGIAELMRTDLDRGNRVAAVRALGALRAGSQLDALADAMAADEKLRPEVLDAFVLIGNTEAAAYAIPFFESRDEDLAAQAMLTAGRLRAGKAVTPLLTVYGSDEPKKGIVGTVTSLFSPERKKAALQALALIGDPRAEDVFTKNFYDKDPDRRRAAYEGIAREADPRYIERVTRDGFREKNRDVQLAQAFALYKMGKPGMMSVIVEALRTSSRRDQAAAYVHEATSPEHLLPFLRERDRDAQRIIIDALGQVGDQQTIAALHPLVRSADTQTALAADRAVKMIEWRAGQPAANP